MDGIFNLLIGCFLFVFVGGIYLYLPNTSKKRHRRNIEMSKLIWEKLNTFEGEHLHAQALSYLRKIDPYVFEELLLTSLEQHGFEVKRSKRYSGDGGIDGKALKEGTLYFIQAKRYKSYVSTKHLENFRKKIGNQKGLFIHTGKTGKETFEKYRNSNLTIISGTRLINLLIKKKQ